MILNKDNGKYITDAQWLRLFELVPVVHEMKLTLPVAEGCDCDLLIPVTGKQYFIHEDGSYNWVKIEV